MKKIIVFMGIVLVGNLYGTGSEDFKGFFGKKHITTGQDLYMKKTSCDRAMQEAVALDLIGESGEKIKALGSTYEEYKKAVDNNVMYLTLKNKNDANAWGVMGAFAGIALYHFIMCNC